MREIVILSADGIRFVIRFDREQARPWTIVWPVTYNVEDRGAFASLADACAEVATIILQTEF